MLIYIFQLQLEIVYLRLLIKIVGEMKTFINPALSVSGLADDSMWYRQQTSIK